MVKQLVKMDTIQFSILKKKINKKNVKFTIFHKINQHRLVSHLTYLNILKNSKKKNKKQKGLHGPLPGK